MGCIGNSKMPPTNTPENTETSTQTLLPTYTSTPYDTQTPSAATTFTLIPTLIPEEEKANILGLLSANGGCGLPCWWGITPGETTRSEVEELSVKYNLRLDEFPKGFSRSIWVDFENGIMQGSIEMGMENNSIKYMKIYAAYYPRSGSKLDDFKKAWQLFAPEKLIPALGIPTRIFIDPGLGPSEAPTTYLTYDIYVLYDTKGIRLVYQVRNELSASRYKICPVFGQGGNAEDDIRILLASPTDIVPIETYDETGIQEHRAIPIEKAAGITPEEFYKLYMQPGKPACFNSLPHLLPGY